MNAHILLNIFINLEKIDKFKTCPSPALKMLSACYICCSASQKRFFIEANNINPDQTGSILGAQWLSGRVLDSRLRGGGFEPY